MKLVRSGGVAGLRREVEVDDADLPEAERTQLAGLVSGARVRELAERPPARGAGADRFQYDLTLEEGGEEVACTVAEDAAPPELKKLVGWLLERPRRAG